MQSQGFRRSPRTSYYEPFKYKINDGHLNIGLIRLKVATEIPKSDLLLIQYVRSQSIITLIQHQILEKFGKKEKRLNMLDLN